MLSAELRSGKNQHIAWIGWEIPLGHNVTEIFFGLCYAISMCLCLQSMALPWAMRENWRTRRERCVFISSFSCNSICCTFRRLFVVCLSKILAEIRRLWAHSRVYIYIELGNIVLCYYRLLHRHHLRLKKNNKHNNSEIK